MNTLKLQLHFNHSNLSNPTINVPLILPIKAKSRLIYPSPKSSHHDNSKTRRNCLLQDVPSPKPKRISTEKLEIISSKEHSRMVVLGAMSLGVALFLMGFDDHKALALGPEGPLMEEFWDNMRRYALYVLTVSTGAIYTLLQPIVELLKNPISAVLILVIIGGSIFIVSQVVTAMVGLSDFSYDYSY
ncbi:hypothetical protein CDL12_08718 [Handroanthus impetiginosus]|uniref:Uncharacterized protein ycf33 n=1 Tax=Handroanthus impetiginosus TaxID=429701 RepID=A0A2G9HM69_9LAMI|nr:hypothetical protein CDL12_25204 [Handroanthus impetiginosus]PIN18615.1 hypothetical protein CDL12_08718 [Handroanthus impetiginosus]